MSAALASPLVGAPWYALTVKPRHEKAAATHLHRRGLEAYLPLYRSRRRWSDRTTQIEMCLFPGYVFCRFGYESRLAVLNAPSVQSIVGFAGQDAAVSEAEIDAVREILSSGRPVLPWDYIRAGEKVRIDGGSLDGLEGILIREKDAWRVVVSVELLQRSVAVEIDRELIRPVR